MIRTQRWIPDTCKSPASGDACSVLETWDDTVTDVARTHSLKTVEKTCSLHTALSGQALFTALYDQNRRKNTTWNLAQSVKASLTSDQFAWSYDANQVLQVSFGTALTSQQKSQLQSLCNTQFGVGKVVIA